MRKNETLLKRWAVPLGPALFVLTGYFIPNAPVLGTLLWMLLWWVTEAIPLGITSLIPLFTFPVFGVLPLAETSKAYGSEVIFLFLGGFILSFAIEKSNLHHMLSNRLLGKFLNHPILFIVGSVFLTGFFSMWISNTASVLIFLPLVRGLIQNARHEHASSLVRPAIFGVAYGASIGGTGTLIGSPTNPLMAHFLKTQFQQEMNFVDWLKFGFPFMVLSLIILSVFLSLPFIFHSSSRLKANDSLLIANQDPSTSSSLRIPWARNDFYVGGIFLLMVAAWMTSGWINHSWLQDSGVSLNDTSIAILGAILLYAIPGFLNVNDLKKVPWDVLLLFGGGIALAGGLEKSGLTQSILQVLTHSGLAQLPSWLFLLGLILIVILFTEIASNTAVVSIVLPLFGPLAPLLGVPPVLFLLSLTFASSLSFMMPMATPPNAIAFASGAFQIKDMMRIGWKLNLIFSIWIAAYAFMVRYFFF